MNKLIEKLKRLVKGAERHRAYFYRIAGIVGTLLVAGGIITDGKESAIMLLVGALLGVGGNGLATANTSTEREAS